MHKHHLQSRSKRGSQRFRPPNDKLLVHVSHESCEYGIPLPAFARSAVSRPTYQGIRSNKCLRKYLLEQGNGERRISASPRYSRLEDLANSVDYGVEVQSDESPPLRAITSVDSDGSASSDDDTDTDTDTNGESDSQEEGIDYPGSDSDEEWTRYSRKRAAPGGARREGKRPRVLAVQKPAAQETITEPQRCAEVVPKSCPTEQDAVANGLHFKMYGECGICMSDSVRTLWNPVDDKPAALCDLFSLVGRGTEGRLPDDIVFSNPCGRDDHLVCVSCFRRVALDRNNPPVNRRNAVLHCVSVATNASQPCQAVYDQRWFAWLMNLEEQQQMNDLYERHRFPGFETVKCPLMRFANGGLEPCGAECLVTYGQVDGGQPGQVLVMCTQNPLCMGRFCYHCNARIYLADSRCQTCTLLGERRNPEAFNRYFHNPAYLSGKCRGNELATSHLLRNKDVTVDLAVKQMEEVLAMDRMTPACNKCGQFMYKTSMCNTMTHCGIEKCYVCGRTTASGGHLENNHWDPEGITGCPRYDNHVYWQRLRPKFCCKEGGCYGDANDCSIPDHQPGIKAMHDERKVWHIWCMMRSLTDEKRRQVLEIFESNGKPGDTERKKVLDRIKMSLAR